MFQPFRNSPMALAEAKSIHGFGEVGQKFVEPSGDMVEKVIMINIFLDSLWIQIFQPFRNSPLVLAEAKSVYGLYDTGNKYKIPSGDMDEKVNHISSKWELN